MHGLYYHAEFPGNAAKAHFGKRRLARNASDGASSQHSACDCPDGRGRHDTPSKQTSMILAFRHNERHPAGVEHMRHIGNNGIVPHRTCTKRVESLVERRARLKIGKSHPSESGNEDAFEPLTRSLLFRIDFAADGTAQHKQSLIEPISALRCRGQSIHPVRRDRLEHALKLRCCSVVAFVADHKAVASDKILRLLNRFRQFLIFHL